MAEKKYLTVTALTKYIAFKFDCDINLKDVYLEGEISNFKHHSRGHFYFTLKDENAAISATMFAGEARKVKFEPEDGMKVLVKGSLSVYQPQGTYSINCYEMEPAGIGSLYLAYEKLKHELEQKGYFAPEHKKDIVKYPKAIAIITSPTGAAVRDCINTIKRRYPLAKIYVYPTLVQGEDAKHSIVKNIKACNKDNLVDTIILGRGGGSIEDLWAFNEEIVVKAIYDSKIPIISGVGHETDTTLSDFVADRRAATPTAAAELATPDIKVLKENINYYLKRMNQDINIYMHNIEKSLLHLDARLELVSPLNRLNKIGDKILDLNKMLTLNINNYLNNKNLELHLLNEKLRVLNPLLIMDKGFSVLYKDGHVVNSVKQVNIGDNIDAKLVDGSISVLVKEINDGK